MYCYCTQLSLVVSTSSTAKNIMYTLNNTPPPTKPLTINNSHGMAHSRCQTNKTQTTRVCICTHTVMSLY